MSCTRTPSASCACRYSVGRRVIEAEADIGELVRVDAVDTHQRFGGVLVLERLHLRREGGAEIELEAGVFHARFLGRLEDVEAPLILRAEMLDHDRAAPRSWVAGLRPGPASPPAGVFSRRRLRRERRGREQKRAQGGGDAKCASHDVFSSLDHAVAVSPRHEGNGHADAISALFLAKTARFVAVDGPGCGEYSPRPAKIPRAGGRASGATARVRPVSAVAAPGMPVALERSGPHEHLAARKRTLMRLATLTVAAAAAVALGTVPHAAGTASLTLTSARVSIEGTSNIHGYTASSTAVKIAAVDVDAAGEDVLGRALEPNAIRAFEVVIPTTSLTSPKDGIDKNMHKALKAAEHPDIRFRLRSLDAAAGTATGQLTIAGVEKEVTLNVQVKRQDAALAVTGTTTLMMTDYGVTPPKAMLGMLKTNPKVTITFELVLGPSLT